MLHPSFTAGDAGADVTVEQKIESSMINGNVILQMKGDRARMEIPSPVGETTVILDVKAGTMTTLIHPQKNDDEDGHGTD